LSKPRGAAYIVNSHERLQAMEFVPKYLVAMRRNEIAKTVIVGAREVTTNTSASGEERYNLEVMRISNVYPECFVAFPAIDPQDPDKMAKLENYIKLGAKGIKLYTGHTSFHNVSLDDPTALPVYEFCQTMRIPVLFHVNTAAYGDEFETVLNGFPRLTVICPHLCLSTADVERLDGLMGSHSNLITDVSFGKIEYLRESLLRISSNSERYREFFLEHQDRILFGTDNVIDGSPHKTVDWIDSMIRVYRDLLEKETYTFFGLNGVALNGLRLGGSTLDRIYRSNSQSFLV
jgi:uncharacterized protein